MYYLEVWNTELRSISKGIRYYHGLQKYRIFYKKITIKRAVNTMVLGINLGTIIELNTAREKRLYYRIPFPAATKICHTR